MSDFRRKKCGFIFSVWYGNQTTYLFQITFQTRLKIDKNDKSNLRTKLQAREGGGQLFQTTFSDKTQNRPKWQVQLSDKIMGWGWGLWEAKLTRGHRTGVRYAGKPISAQPTDNKFISYFFCFDFSGKFDCWTVLVFPSSIPAAHRDRKRHRDFVFAAEISQLRHSWSVFTSGIKTRTFTNGIVQQKKNLLSIAKHQTKSVGWQFSTPV